MIRILFLLTTLLIPEVSRAQKEYIITTAGDTLTGKVIRGNLNRNHVVLKNQKKYKFHLSEIKEWNAGSTPVVVWKDTTGKRTVYHEFAVRIQGKVKLFNDIFYSFDQRYVIQIKDEFIVPSSINMTNHIWDRFIECKSFTNKYGKYTKEEAGQLFNESKITNLKEVIVYYNNNCD
jgi:hypothetical protein